MEKLYSIYGDSYIYDKFEYSGYSKPVTLICKRHGEFTKSAALLFRGYGCPKCAKELYREKLNSPAMKANYKQRAVKARQTLLDKYGVINVMQLDSTKDKLRCTLMEKYGVDNIRKSPEAISKSKRTMIERYGVSSYSKTEEFKNKVRKTNLERYGADNFMKSDYRFAVLDDMIEKSKRTQMERYGVEHYSKSDDAKRLRKQFKEKEFETRRKNGTLNSSGLQNNLYDRLVLFFGDADVLSEYDKDKRYPFHCDFYIKSLDLFIELNGYYTHNDHWFDSHSEDDLAVVAEWKMRDKSDEYGCYSGAIYDWTVRDVKKRRFASDNNLNYVVFWDGEQNSNGLTDEIEQWFNEGCPIRQDWK